MIIALERSRFNILYKFNEIEVGMNSVIDLELNEINSRITDSQRFESLVREFDRIIPTFELDHEVLLLQLDKSKINLSGELTVYFGSILSIYPLTSNGARLLFGKLNEGIRIEKPIFETVILRLKSERNLRLRISCAKRLIDIFDLERPVNQHFRNTLQAAAKSIIYNTGIDEPNFLYSLLQYDRTPNYLPTGNTEFLLKVGLITLVSNRKDEEIVRNGDFYRFCIAKKELINKGSIFEGFSNFIPLLENEDLRRSYLTLIDLISPKFDSLDLFKISYYFLAIKSLLNKSDKDLTRIANELYYRSKEDPETFVHVILLIGYTFSFDELYESIHILERAPVLQSKLSLGGVAKGTDNNFSEKCGNESQNQAVKIQEKKNEPIKKIGNNYIEAKSILTADPITNFSKESLEKANSEVPAIEQFNDTDFSQEVTPDAKEFHEKTSKVPTFISPSSSYEIPIGELRNLISHSTMKPNKIKDWEGFIDSHFNDLTIKVSFEWLIENIDYYGLRKKLLHTNKETDPIKKIFGKL